MSGPQIIRIHEEAPAKPVLGAPCNGCGVCCLAEPCPLGVLLSGHFKGQCKALRWSDSERAYRCGALGISPAVGWVAQWRSKVVARWIAAGAGCDCELESAASLTIPVSSRNEIESHHD